MRILGKSVKRRPAPGRYNRTRTFPHPGGVRSILATQGRVKMANRLSRLARRALLVAGMVVTGLAGGVPSEREHRGDPLFGNFNRRSSRPAAGARADSAPRPGLRRRGPDRARPDVPARSTIRPGSEPAAAVAAPLSGPGCRSASDTTSVVRAGPAGARWHDPGTAPLTVPTPAYGLAGPNAVAPRPRDGTSQIMSATAFIPAGPPPQVQVVRYELFREPSRIASVDEGQQLLNSIGAKGMRTEQLQNGDWSFCCTIGTKPYEGRGCDALDALRQVAELVQRDK